MKEQSSPSPEIGRVPIAALLNCALAIGVAWLPGCSRADKAPQVNAPDGNATSGPSDPKDGGATSARTAPPAIEAKPINLREVAMIAGAEVIGRSPANLSYKAKGDAKSAYEFQRTQLVALGWKEEPNSSVTEQSASGVFTGAGYTLSASVYPGSEPGSVNVMLHNHGNVDLAALPLPPGTKPVYVGPVSSMHVTNATVADATATVRQLLMDAGWEPHGSEGNSWHYKQGLNRISVTISSAPAQGGKTMIDYAGELMSSDLPAPPDALDVRYVDTRQELTFATSAEKEVIVGFYKQKLATTGWTQSENQSLRIDDYDQLAFRNPDGGAIFLKIKLPHQGKRNVSVGYLSVDDIADLKKVKPPVQAPAEKGAGEKEVR